MKRAGSEKKAFAVIPARAGSKRIPGKNIRNFLGHPVIEYPIRAAKDSQIFEQVIVSTDSVEISQISINSGARVPFLRPAELSGDEVRAEQVMAHAAQWIEEIFGPADICCILPTTPGLKPSDLVSSHRVWKQVESDYKTLFGVVEYSNSAFRSFKLSENGLLIPMFLEELQLQSQDLPLTYGDAGHFYWASSETWKNSTSITAEKGFGWPLDPLRTVDINSEFDWKLAELLIGKLLA